MKELKEALKKTKNIQSPGEDNFNVELYKYAEDSLHERVLVFK